MIVNVSGSSPEDYAECAARIDELDGFITDTPGFTSLDLFELGIEYRSVVGGYPEIERLSSGWLLTNCLWCN